MGSGTTLSFNIAYLFGMITFFLSPSFPICALGTKICHRFAVRTRVKNDGMFPSVFQVAST